MKTNATKPASEPVAVDRAKQIAYQYGVVTKNAVKAIAAALAEGEAKGRATGLYTEEITYAVINAIGESEGEPIGLRAGIVLAAIDKHIAAGEPLAVLVRDAERYRWQPIETSPKDGTRVDLLYPYPRGRTINCQWRDDAFMTGWYWKTPRWEDGKLLPEEEWGTNSYPNMEPTHWMRSPEEPRSSIDAEIARDREGK